MRFPALFRRAIQAKVAQATKPEQSQQSAPSGSRVARAAASTSAILLLIASAGFGCIFALTQAMHHGPVLAAFALAMALGLELAKPFAVEGMFASLRSWAFGRALAMTLLAAVTIGYSLTAELSLMAMTRGDAAAGRSQVTDTAKDDRAELARLTAERSAMAFSPATEEAVSISREMVSAAERTRKVGCRERGKNCRAREAEEAAARTVLATAIASKAATDRAREIEKGAAAIRLRIAQAPATASADPGASALANYLAIFGVTISASLLSEWLVLVGVIALEVGSALAVVLVRAAGSPQEGPTARSDVLGTQDTGKPRNAVPGAPAPQETASVVELKARQHGKGTPAASGGRVSKKSTRGRPAKERLKAEAKVIDILKARGGRLSSNSTTRKLGRMAGVRKSTMHLALAGLIAAGVVARGGGGLVLTG